MQCKSEKANEYLCPFRSGSCNGSACMAWRWVRVTDPTQDVSVAEPPNPYKTFIDTDEGYCGLVK
jgi:hypothetical protein